MSGKRHLTTFAIAILLGAASLAAHADAGDPPALAGRLHAVDGSVSIQPADVNQWTQVADNYPIASGDRLYSDQNSRAEIQLGSMAVRLWQSTDLTFTNLADQLTQMGLAQGTIRVRTFALNPGEQVEVDTPNGSLTVVQPGDFRVDSYTGDGGTVVTVTSGQVQVTGPGLSEYINAGQSVQLEGTNPIQLASVQMPAPDAFDSWCVERDRHILNAQSRQYVSTDVVGYDDLDGYGSWANDADYGPVWYPGGVAVDWVPYRFGHWVWVSPWGWIWVEDEPWGYAPFHYGRWAYIGSRWGWIPGPIVPRPVWAPAFVAFAGGGGFTFGAGGVAAWFPLGPGEPFYPWYHCSPTYIRNINITNINITRIRDVTIVNNYNTFIRHVDNPNNVHIEYANRTRAFTAVNGQAFASARPVRENLVHMDPAQIERAQVVPHPSISPTIEAKIPHPVNTVRVPMQRPTLLVQGGREQEARPGATLQNVPRAPQHPVEAQQPPRPNEPERPVTPEPYNGNREAYQQKPLIGRTPPPPAQPSFAEKQKAMETHPGRPLEPQQVDNLRQGRPAGPPQDREWPSHPAQTARPEAPRLGSRPH